MEECPRANEHKINNSKYTVDFESHYGQKACYMDDCTVLVNDDDSYSYIKHDYKRKVAERIKIVGGVETEVLRSYSLDGIKEVVG